MKKLLLGLLLALAMAIAPVANAQVLYDLNAGQDDTPTAAATSAAPSAVTPTEDTTDATPSQAEAATVQAVPVVAAPSAPQPSIAPPAVTTLATDIVNAPNSATITSSIPSDAGTRLPPTGNPYENLPPGATPPGRPTVPEIPAQYVNVQRPPTSALCSVFRPDHCFD